MQLGTHVHLLHVLPCTAALFTETSLNLSKPEIHVNNNLKFSAYITKSLFLRYEESVNTVCGSTFSLFGRSYETHIYTVFCKVLFILMSKQVVHLVTNVF
jgi:hypothetical protein